MARILLLTPQLPYPPQQGNSLRNWHILRGLSERHEVSLLGFTDHEPEYLPEPLVKLCQYIETVPVPGQRATTQRIAQLMQSTTPDMAQRLSSEAFATALKRRLQTERYDIVQIEGLEMAHLMPTIRANSNAAIVLDCHNAETELQRRAYATDSRLIKRWPAALYSRLQINRLAEYESWALQTADARVAVSVQDAEFLSALVPKGLQPLTVVPNSIDVAEYMQTTTAVLPGQVFDLVFSGKMDYRPNVDAALWFADTVWPQLRQARPGLTWGIVGQRPHKQLDRLRDVAGITITGKVEKVQPYLAAAKVIIMPLRMGSGTRLKLIEAMAGAKAIVSTTVGAEGFPVEDGTQLLLADNQSAQADAVGELLDDDGLRGRLGLAAREFARAYDWRVVVPEFDAVYNAVISTRGTTNRQN